MEVWLFDIMQWPYRQWEIPYPFPGSMYDPKLGKELFDGHLAVYKRADELGYDGVCFAEHHYGTNSVDPSPNLMAAAVATHTERAGTSVDLSVDAPEAWASAGDSWFHPTKHEPGGRLDGAAKWGAYASAELFLLPSRQENFAITVAEAMQMGVPVVISNRVNTWPYVKAAGAGVVDAASERRIAGSREGHEP